MRKIAQTFWGTKRIRDSSNGGWEFTLKTKSSVATVVDLGLRVAGTAAMYGIGMLGGEILDQIPVLNEAAYNVVNYLSGIDVTGNLDGLVGLAGAVSGFIGSGIKLDDNSMELKSLSLKPLTLNYK